MHAFLFLLTAAVAGAQPQASKTFEPPASDVQIVDAVILTAVAPRHAGGKVDVVISAFNGTTTAPGGFTFSSRRRVVRH